VPVDRIFQNSEQTNRRKANEVYCEAERHPDGGINGSAYLVGGFGMTALTGNNMVVVPIRSGIGLRLGANLGWLKFTDSPTWNPF
jgi:hypothetical protein